MTIQPITPENCHLSTPYGLLIWSLDQVVAQGTRSHDPSDHACKYRKQEPDGTLLKCGVGHCITDHEYSSKMESSAMVAVLDAYSSGTMPTHEPTRLLFLAMIRRFDWRQMKALQYAQWVHDFALTFEIFKQQVARIKLYDPDRLMEEIQKAAYMGQVKI